MTFLNTALLAALTLGLLPILIHLLNRQKFKQIDFPTLRFLREMQRQKMRQVKVRQIFLLILRTLAILFLVLAMTRPVLNSTAGILPGAEAHSTSVLILDRSASMQTETPDGTRFRRLQTRAQSILSTMQDGDEVQFVWADSEPARFPETPTTHLNLLRETITEAQVSQTGGDLIRALQTAREILGRSNNLHKEVYVLSDFSQSAWPEQLPESAVLPEDVRLFLLPVDEESHRNLGITSATITSRLITPGRAVEIGFTVLNSGDISVEDRIVSVYLEGQRVAQTRVSLSAGESRELTLKFVPETPGAQTGYVRVEDADDLSADDIRNFVLRVPSRLRIALAGNDGPARELAALALNPMKSPEAFVDAKTFLPSEFEALDWSVFDAVVIVDADGFSSSFESRLRAYVEDGRGVFIIPGSQSDLRSYSTWLSSLGLPGLTEVDNFKDAPVRWTNPDLKHPFFEGLFVGEPQSISPDINKLVKTNGTGTALEIISAGSGSPFLLESKVGRGRALLMLTSTDPEWSSLYRSGIFPPLMIGSMAYLSGIGTSGEEFQLTAGVPSSLSFTGRSGDEPFELQFTDKTISLAVSSAPNGYQISIPALEIVGSAKVRQADKLSAVLVFNSPGKESELRPLPESSYSKILGGKQTELASDQNVESAVMEGRFGRELWKLCLFAALLLLLTEMLVSRVGRKEAIA